jgi:hypothetical protein
MRVGAALRPRPPVVAALLGAAVVALAGCGTTDDGPDDAGPTFTQHAPPVRSPAGDRRVARASLLLEEDLPAGWAADPGDPPGQPGGRTDCTGLEEAKATLSGRGSAGGFRLDRLDSRVGQVIYVYPTTTKAEAALRGMNTPSDLRCEGRLNADTVRAGLRDGAEVTGVRTGRDETQGFPPHSIASHTTLTFRDGSAGTFLAVYTRVDRAVSYVLATGTATSELRIIDATAARKMRSFLP